MSSARTATGTPKVIILAVAKKEPDQLLLDDLNKRDFPWGKEKLNWELREIQNPTFNTIKMTYSCHFFPASVTFQRK